MSNTFITPEQYGKEMWKAVKDFAEENDLTVREVLIDFAGYWQSTAGGFPEDTEPQP